MMSRLWADDELMMSWWWIDDELMMSWWWPEDDLMMTWWWSDYNDKDKDVVWCIGAWVTRPERPEGTKDRVSQEGSRPKGRQLKFGAPTLRIKYWQICIEVINVVSFVRSPYCNSPCNIQWKATKKRTIIIWRILPTSLYLLSFDTNLLLNHNHYYDII